MAALDLITLAEFKNYRPVTQGTSKDSTVFPGVITAASRMIENELGRRIRYRAPAEVDGAANLLPSTNFVNGALAGVVQPSSSGRTLIVNFSSGLTAGVLTVTGTVGGVAGVVKTFDVADGQVQHGLDFFTAISAMAASGVAGSGTVKVGSSLGYVEYHTLTGTPNLRTLEWPVKNTPNEVNEDISRTYGTTTRLVLGTDYLLHVGGLAEPAKVIRINGPYPRWWFGGWRAVKLVYSAGYQIASIPQEIKDACGRLAVLLFKEFDQGQIEVASGSNVLGTWTRSGPATLTKAMRDQLAAYRRYRYDSDTGVRDFDLEAA